MFYSGKRQRFLINQGYSFKVLPYPFNSYQKRGLYALLSDQIEIIK
jgi:hypothetical protein